MDSDQLLYLPGCLVWDASSSLRRRLGLVLPPSPPTLDSSLRRVLWSDGSFTIEGVRYLRTFYGGVERF